jgi:hypothetical protein
VEFLKLLNGEEGCRAEEPFRVNDLRFELELAQFGLDALDVIAAQVGCEISALEFQRSVPVDRVI